MGQRIRFNAPYGAPRLNADADLVRRLILGTDTAAELAAGTGRSGETKFSTDTLELVPYLEGGRTGGYPLRGYEHTIEALGRPGDFTPRSPVTIRFDIAALSLAGSLADMPRVICPGYESVPVLFHQQFTTDAFFLTLYRSDGTPGHIWSDGTRSTTANEYFTGTTSGSATYGMMELRSVPDEDDAGVFIWRVMGTPVLFSRAVLE